MSEKEVDSIARLKGFPKHNENSITSIPGLKRELARVRALGFSLDDEEDEIGERCIGAPIFDANAAIIAAISVAGTVSQIPNERITALAKLLKRTAAEISSHLRSIRKGSPTRGAEAGSFGQPQTLASPPEIATDRYPH